MGFRLASVQSGCERMRRALSHGIEAAPYDLSSAGIRMPAADAAGMGERGVAVRVWFTAEEGWTITTLDDG